jgi:hypothetical protein
MTNNPVLAFGGLLLGLGVGHIILQEYTIGASTIAWILMIIGATIVLSTLIKWASPKHGLHHVVGGAAGGLVLALFITQGFTVFGSFGNFGNLPYSTTQQKTYEGASMASTVSLRLGSINGPITVQIWDRNEYQIVASIMARGNTQSEADQNLANLGKDWTEETSAGAQTLSLVYSSSIFINNPYRIAIEVRLPASAKLSLDLMTSNGAITIENVTGETVKVLTSNGRIYTENVKAKTISLMTSNADVDVVVDTTAAYKLDALTSNGKVDFNLPNLTYTRNQATSKVAETSGYSSAQIKVQVTIRTSNADVTVDKEN